MAVERSGQASAEIEITDRMVEAGADRLWCLLGQEGEGLAYYRLVAREVFELMWMAHLSETACDRGESEGSGH